MQILASVLICLYGLAAWLQLKSFLGWNGGEDRNCGGGTLVYTHRISSCDAASAQDSSGAYHVVCEQQTNLATKSQLEIRWVYLTAVCLHGYLLYRVIDTSEGQNLSFANMFSLIAWLIAGGSIIFRSNQFKFLTGVLAAISIGVALTAHTKLIVKTALLPAELAHILLVVVTISALSLAGLQALLCHMQNKFLRKPQLHKALQATPALETAETLLFRLLLVSFMLLMAVWGSAHIYLHIEVGHDLPGFRSQGVATIKNSCTMLALAILGGLLICRHGFGLRGAIAIRGALLSLLCLIIAFSVNYYG